MFKTKKPVSYTAIILGLGIILLAAIVFSFFMGRFPITPAQLFGILLSKVFNIQQFWTDQMETILFNVRLPRVLLACLVGCSLSTAGASYQGIFQNPMAAPDILGATSGAAFGAALAILNNANSLTITLYAFFFSLLTVSIVYLISKKARGHKVLGLVLSGIIDRKSVV
jgi:iron complex transport system permease protein